MIPDQYKQLSSVAFDVTKNSSGTFVAPGSCCGKELVAD